MGVKLSGGTMKPADDKIDGRPSTLFYAVALALSDEVGRDLAENKPAQDSVSDVFAHAKFVAGPKLRSLSLKRLESLKRSTAE